MRVGRRARGARREARLEPARDRASCWTRPASASCSRLIIIRGSRTRRCPTRAEGADDHESARPVPQSGPAQGPAARGRRPAPASADRRDVARARRGASLVVHGSGLDEVALHGFTQAVLLDQDGLEEIEITPEEAGLRGLPIDRSSAASPQENAARLSRILAARAARRIRSIVALNAGALLMTASRAPDLRTGVAIALDAMASGKALDLLDRFVEASRG